MEEIRILAINPGSTSTKIAVYHNEDPIFVKNIKHSNDDLDKYESIVEQLPFRKQLIIDELNEAEISEDHVKAVVGRGGLVKPIESGVYEVNEAMIADLKNPPMGEHASNLGGLIAKDIANTLPGAKAYITDPVVVDELSDVARISGHPAFQRKSIFHALNQKAVARQHAQQLLKKYEDLNLIVVHLGGGVTVGAHQRGWVVDVNQGLDGEGPFSPERSGTLPVGDLVKACFSGKYTEKEIKKMITGKGGLVAYLDTNNAYDVEQRVKAGDEYAKLIYSSMAYQVSKSIGSMAAVLKGDIDGILITGGIAHDKWFTKQIIEHVERLAPVYIYPGEDEMRALSMNALRVLKGEITPKVYQ
jgi:butyrate kinase